MAISVGFFSIRDHIATPYPPPSVFRSQEKEKRNLVCCFNTLNPARKWWKPEKSENLCSIHETHSFLVVVVVVVGPQDKKKSIHSTLDSFLRERERERNDIGIKNPFLEQFTPALKKKPDPIFWNKNKKKKKSIPFKAGWKGGVEGWEVVKARVEVAERVDAQGDLFFPPSFMAKK